MIPVLTACGGGGGGSSGGASSPSVANIAWPVNATAARQAVTGSSAPAKSTAEAIQEIRAINNDANQVDVADGQIFVGTESPIRLDFSCSNLVCTGTALGETITEAFEDYTDANFGYDVAEVQPVMVHNGVNIMQIRAREDIGTQDQFEVLAYGGWMEYSAFLIEVGHYPTVARSELAIALPYAFGTSPGTNPAMSTTFTATWTGAVVGMDYSFQNRGHVIHGAATIGVNYGTSRVNVRFSDLVDLDDATRTTIPDINWPSISITGGAFTAGLDGDHISGRFYGTNNHEEVAGAFDRNQITGAFGAIRGTQ